MPINLLIKERRSFKFAFEGMIHAFKTQTNFKIQLLLGVIAVIFGLILNFSSVEWAILLLSICLVLSSELVNTAVESVVDLTTGEIHPKAKIAKDVSAGVVLIISIFVLVVGLLLYLPHFF